MTRARDLASLGDNTSKLEQQGLVQVVATSVTKGASGSASVDSKGNVTFSGTESIALIGIFTSTYENYKIVVTFSDATADGQIWFKLRAGATDNSSGYYWGTVGRNAAGTVYNNYAANDTGGFFVVNADAGQPDIVSAEITLFNPQLARKTKFIGNAAGAENAGNITSFFGAGSHNATTAYDSVNFYNTSGGTLSGTIRVYGYNQ
jgi:hypothetical protein